MKRLSAFCLMLLFAVSAFAGKLEHSVSLNASSFQIPGEEAYVEVNFSIFGKGVEYEKLAYKKHKAQVEVVLLLKQGDEIVNYEKYILESPTVADTNEIDFNLVDQKRLTVPEGEVILEAHFNDLVNAENTVMLSQPLDVKFSEELMVSDIQLLESFEPAKKETQFTKYGFDLTPRSLNFLPTTVDTLIFYGEIYNSSSAVEDQFLITCGIKQHGSETVKKDFWTYQKQEAAPVNVVLQQFDISELPSGNYDVVIEVRNKKNEVLTTKRLFFFRSNQKAVVSYDNLALIDYQSKFVSEFADEQLDRYISLIKPIARPHEQNLLQSIENGQDYEMKRRFFYNFWNSRNEEHPRAEWERYYAEVKEVNEKYGAIGKEGHRTDRGRVRLQYGEPAEIITSVNEPGALPYEIWHFYVTNDGQRNVKFVFYDPSNVSNDYVMIHSDAVGELFDLRWKMRIYANMVKPEEFGDMENQDIIDRPGFRAGEIFDDN